MLPLFVQQHIQKVSHIFLCCPCFLPNSIAIFMEWNVSGMCTPVSAAAAATSFGQREVCARQEEVLGISKESSFLCGGVQLQVFFSSLLMAFLSPEKEK